MFPPLAQEIQTPFETKYPLLHKLGTGPMHETAFVGHAYTYPDFVNLK